MVRQKITDVAIELMKKEGTNWIGYDSFGLLQDVWDECFKRGVVKEFGSRGGKQINHAKNKFIAVLNALDRDKERFKKGFIMCCGGKDMAECRVRVFELKGGVNSSQA